LLSTANVPAFRSFICSHSVFDEARLVSATNCRVVFNSDGDKCAHQFRVLFLQLMDIRSNARLAMVIVRRFVICCTCPVRSSAAASVGASLGARELRCAGLPVPGHVWNGSLRPIAAKHIRYGDRAEYLGIVRDQGPVWFGFNVPRPTMGISLHLKRLRPCCVAAASDLDMSFASVEPKGSHAKSSSVCQASAWTV